MRIPFLSAGKARPAGGAETAAAARPIFLFGVGRCGSTYLQTLLSRVADIWIWGENDGIAPRLLDWGDTLLASRPLSEWSFPMPPEQIAGLVRSGKRANELAWLNGFRPDDIREIERELFVRLFSVRLPPGKTRWGYKEIRHGPHDRIPERLLELFPEARIVHTVRHPVATVESSVVAWNWKLAREDDADAKLAERYAFYAERWQAVTAYFLDLEARDPDRVGTFRIETVRDDLDRLARFLGIGAIDRDEVERPLPVNRRRSGFDGEEETMRFLAGRRPQIADIVMPLARRIGYASLDPS